MRELFFLLDEQSDVFLVAGVVAAVLFLLGFVLMLAKRYKRCPSNKVLVIYGKVTKGQSAKVLHGGGTFVWPLIQSYDYLDLDPIQIDIPLKGALSAENIRVNVPSVFTVAVGTQPAIMNNAAVRLLGLRSQEVMQQARDIIFGQLRQVIAAMQIDAINRDRDVFLNSIQESLEPELAKIGLELINVNITDITDESGYIEALGRKAASEAIQKAEVDVAEQRKKGSIGVAEAERERAIAVAQADKVREIGTKEASRDQVVRVAELDKERVIGEQTASYERETAVKEAERAMRIKVAAANATAVAGENESKAKVADANATLHVREADAYALAETRKREAEAAVLEAQYLAEAKAAAANAEKVEAEQRAALEAPARAEKARIVVDAQAEAEKAAIQADGRAKAMAREAEGEAAAIFAKLEAEARGQFEILAKKGEGLREIVAACGGSQEAFQLLMLEHLDHLAETASKAIANIKFDKVTVWDSGNGKSGGASGFLRNLGSSLPPLLDVMRNIGGVELPEFLGKLVEQQTASENGQVAAGDDAGPKAAQPVARGEAKKGGAGGS